MTDKVGEVVEKVLDVLALEEGLTVAQAVDVLEATSMKLRSKSYEAMAIEASRKVSEVFKPKSNIKVVSSIQ